MCSFNYYKKVVGNILLPLRNIYMNFLLEIFSTPTVICLAVRTERLINPSVPAHFHPNTTRKHVCALALNYTILAICLLAPISFACQKDSTLRSSQISSNARVPNSYNAAQYFERNSFCLGWKITQPTCE